MLLDVFGPNFQVPLHPIFNAINFEMDLLMDASPSDVMAHLMKTWNEGTVRYFCMGLEEFVQIEPLPLTERATCMCQNCAGQSKSSIQGVTQIASLEARLGLDIREETVSPKTPLDLKLLNDKDTFRIEEFSKLLQLSDDLFQPQIPSYIAQALAFMTEKGELRQKRCISLESLFADDLYGLDFSSQQLGTKTKKLNLQIQPEMERDEDIDSDTTWNSKFLNFFITPEVLPYFSVTEHAPDDYYGDFKVY